MLLLGNCNNWKVFPFGELWFTIQLLTGIFKILTFNNENIFS